MLTKDRTLHSILIYVEYEQIKLLNFSTLHRARFWGLGAAISISYKGRTGQCPNARMASTPLLIVYVITLIKTWWTTWCQA